MKKIKKSNIWVEWKYIYPRSINCNHLILGYEFSLYCAGPELLFRCMHYYDEEKTIFCPIADNVQFIVDDINRFLLLKNYALTDKALFFVENELFNVFNGFSKDFNSLFLINER